MTIVKSCSEALVSAERSEVEADIVFPEHSPRLDSSNEWVDHTVFRQATDFAEVVDAICETVVAAGKCCQVNQLSVSPAERVKVKAERKIEAAIRIRIGGARTTRDHSMFVDYNRETVDLAVGAAEGTHINQLITMVMFRVSLS